MKILAIDPGPEKSAWLGLDDNTIEFARIDDNDTLLAQLYNIDTDNRVCVFEMVQSYGMPVGRAVFETVFWIGRFYEALGSVRKARLYRSTVKAHLCNSVRAKDSNIRQALIDRFGPGREKAIGTKKSPGPLYGIKKDLWSALALAVTYADHNETKT